MQPKMISAPLTPKKNKQKQQAKHTRQQALNWLAQKFPEAFNNERRIRPLKIGIMHEIMTYADEALSAGISKTKLREAVVLFTRRIDYLTCLKAREQRIDLLGHPIERVTEEDAEKANLKIKKRVEKACKHATTVASPARVVPNRLSKPQSQSRSHQDYSYNQLPRFQTETVIPKTTTSITVKRKFTRPIEPEVAQKLREKLDLE